MCCTNEKYGSTEASAYEKNAEYMDKLGEVHLQFSDYCSSEMNGK